MLEKKNTEALHAYGGRNIKFGNSRPESTY